MAFWFTPSLSLTSLTDVYDSHVHLYTSTQHALLAQHHLCYVNDYFIFLCLFVFMSLLFYVIL